MAIEKYQTGRSPDIKFRKRKEGTEVKKTMVVVAVMAMVLSFGPAFAGNLQAADGSKLFNGVTYFDLGPVPTCASASATTNQQKTVALFKGITVFDNGQESGAKGSYANQAAKQIMSSKGYNGITVF
jgi:hypothetical protein